MVGISVIGAGNWGKNLVRNFAAVQGGQLRYICDLDKSVRDRMARQYPQAIVTADTAAAITDEAVSAVVIVVQARYHYQLARTALAAGKHVYCEKPLTLDTRQAVELVELAEAVDRKLMVGHLLEYHPAVNYIKAAIEDNVAGEALYLYFQRVNLGVVRQSENAWWSLAPHDVSVACYLFGGQPVSVTATGQSYLQEGVEDVVFANLKFADGRMAHIHVSWLDPHKVRKVTLVGSEKMITFDDMAAGEKVCVYDKGATVQRGVNSYAEAISLRTGDILIPRIPSSEPLALECRHFIDCITKDRRPLSDGADGVRVVRVLEAGSRSLAQGGQPVYLAPRGLAEKELADVRHSG